MWIDPAPMSFWAQILTQANQQQEFENLRILGEFPGDRLGKITPLSTDIEVDVEKSVDIQKLSTELSTYTQCSGDQRIPDKGKR